MSKISSRRPEVKSWLLVMDLLLSAQILAQVCAYRLLVLFMFFFPYSHSFY
jgi:hypothetical protein